MGTGIDSRRQIDPLLRALDDLGYRPGEPPRLEKRPDGVLLRRKRPSVAGQPNAPPRDWKADGKECAASGPESSGRADTELSDGLRRVIEELRRIYRGDRDRVAAFLSRPHPLLDGEAPFDMANSGSAGAERVLELIDRAEAGMPV